jgi:hypothetical protein
VGFQAYFVVHIRKESRQDPRLPTVALKTDSGKLMYKQILQDI